MKELIFTILFSSGILLSFAQTIETISGQMNASGGVSVDKFGNIYVADFGLRLSNANGTLVYKISPDGVIDTLATGLAGASGNVLDDEGNLYQSNIAGGYISKITPTGNVSTFVSANVAGPVGLEFDSEGNLFVCNCSGNTILKVDSSGNGTIHSSSPLLNCPNGITRGENDTMYVSNFSNSFVLEIAPDGTTKLKGVILGGRNGHIEYANNRFYVASHGSHQIHVMERDGSVSLLAGTGTRGNADGSALNASLSVPNGVGASPTGDTLYFNCTVPTTVYPDFINPSEVRRIVGLHQASATSRLFIRLGKLSITPNPSQDFVNIEMNILEKQAVQLSIISLDGKQVYAQQLGNIQGKHLEQVNIQQLPKGVYLINLLGEDTAISKRLVVR